MTPLVPPSRTVPVDGGELHVGDWGGDGPVVLAIHGITASHVSWAAVAARLTGCRLVAPDLRGRGRSRDLPGPYGLQRHAEDMLGVLDELGCAQAILVGHSMGGFVATSLAAAQPDRVSSLVLVDGGLPLVPAGPPPVAEDSAGQDESGLGPSGLGPAGDRLAMTFDNVEDYRDFWRGHPAFGPMWSPAVQAYVDYDLYGTPPQLYPTCRAEALAADMAVTTEVEQAARTLRAVRTPAVFLRAVRGFLDEPPPLYAQQTADEWVADLPWLSARTVEDTNHYSILMSDDGATAVAEAVRHAVGASRQGAGR